MFLYLAQRKQTRINVISLYLKELVSLNLKEKDV